MNRLSEFFEDGTGLLSATRLGFILWVVGVLVMWAMTCVSTRTLAAIDPSVTTVLGVLMTGKVVQSFGESKQSKTSDPP